MHITRVDPNTSQMQAVYDLRHLVFVEEQGVPLELERDNADATAIHLAAWTEDDQAIGTLRILSKGKAAKIGRVAVHPDHRRKGLATQMLTEAMRYSAKEGHLEACLDAQIDALALYEKLGFIATGDTFWDAGILHQYMHRPLEQNA